MLGDDGRLAPDAGLVSMGDHFDWGATAQRDALAASSGETLRQALAGGAIACLADFMSRTDREAGHLVELLAGATLSTEQAIHAVYYRNTALSARISCLLDILAQRLPTLL